MKAKMGEIDGKMAIYRRNLGQNSRWNTNLSLKFKSGRWITNWDKSGRWITLLTLESHLGCWINARVIWVVRSRWREERNISKKSAILSPKYRRFIGNFLRPQAIIWGNRRFIGDFLWKIVPPIFLLEMPCRRLPIQDISAIYCRYIPIFSSMSVSNVLFYMVMVAYLVY